MIEKLGEPHVTYFNESEFLYVGEEWGILLIGIGMYASEDEYYLLVRFDEANVLTEIKSAKREPFSGPPVEFKSPIASALAIHPSELEFVQYASDSTHRGCNTTKKIMELQTSLPSKYVSAFACTSDSIAFLRQDAPGLYYVAWRHLYTEIDSVEFMRWRAIGCLILDLDDSDSATISLLKEAWGVAGYGMNKEATELLAQAIQERIQLQH